MKWNKPTLEEYDVAELTKKIIANANSINPGQCSVSQCSCTACSCSCAAACDGIIGFACSQFFIIVG